PQKETRSCNYCHKIGHLKKDCWLLKRKENLRNRNTNGDKNVNETAWTAYVKPDEEKYTTIEIYLDTGASNHYTGTKELLHDIEQVKDEHVFGIGGKMNVVGKGTMKTKAILPQDKVQINIREVYYVPGLSTTLISAGKLIQKGIQIDLTNLWVKDKGRIIAYIDKCQNNLFKMKL